MFTPEIEPVNAASNKKVLVIDDQPVIREVVQICLEDLAHWNVTTAKSGLEGLIKVSQQKPDGIILDVMMPSMDGFSILRQLKTNPETKSIPVFFLTAESELTEPQNIVALGLAGALIKPFEPYELVEAIAKAFGWKFY